MSQYNRQMLSQKGSKASSVAKNRLTKAWRVRRGGWGVGVVVMGELEMSENRAIEGL